MKNWLSVTAAGVAGLSTRVGSVSSSVATETVPPVVAGGMRVVVVVGSTEDPTTTYEDDVHAPRLEVLIRHSINVSPETLRENSRGSMS